MKTLMKAVEPAERSERIDQIRPHQLEALTLVERLHRRLLDIIKDEFDRRGRSDINAAQALLLYNIGDKGLTVGELWTRGYYLGSNVSPYPDCELRTARSGGTRPPGPRFAISVLNILRLKARLPP